MGKNNSLINNKLLITISFLLFFSAGVANAATLYLYPSSGSYNVNQNFSVVAYVSSSDQAMNAASGTISFSQDKLEIISLSKSGSIFTLWVQEPSFSNSSGTINFEGIVLNPGFTGSAGKIITLNFRARATGNASLIFSSGSVLANDGKGTNILTSMGSANYFFQTTEITPPTEEIIPPATLGVPLAPKVSSPTHPEPEKWYSNNNPEFTWKLPPDVTGVSIFLNEKSVSDPGPISDGLMESKKYENIEDGIYYFHIKFQNNYGWGEIAHRKVLIDVKPPLPFDIETQREDFSDPQPILLFETTDELSGINYYKMKISQGDYFPAEIIKTQSYKLPPQAPGEHSVIVKAFDMANNFSESATEVVIEPIQSPIISEFPERLSPGEALILRGKASPDSSVFIFIQKEEEEPEKFEVKADKDGNFSFVYDKKPEKGIYKVWAQTQDEREALSLPSQEISVPVTLPIFLKFGKIAIDYLTIMITLILLIVGVIAIILYTWYRISLWRKKLRTETKELAQTIYGAFRDLREEVQEQIEYLDKRPGLAPGEKKVRDKLQEALDVSEKFISKELKDIEKELE